jgi:hypothetical protein
MTCDVLLIDYQGTYGGPSSRDEVLRVLREALALVEATPRAAAITCAGLRIESSAPAGGPSRRPGRTGAAHE